MAFPDRKENPEWWARRKRITQVKAKKRELVRRRREKELLKAGIIEPIPKGKPGRPKKGERPQRNYYDEGKDRRSKKKYKVVGSDGLHGNPKWRLPSQYFPGFMRKMDHRGSQYIRLQKNFDIICNQLGGELELSRLQLALIEHVVFLMEVLQAMEIDMIEDRDYWQSHQESLIKGINLFQSLCKTLGLKKHKVQKSLKVYLKEDATG
jgi:hypothetical protein